MLREFEVLPIKGRFCLAECYVLLLDGQVLPEQYRPERIRADDAQELLARVVVRPDPRLSRRFPEEHSARVRVHLRNGHTLEREQHDYEGFHTRPMGWDLVTAKFNRLAARHVDSARRAELVEAVRRIDELQVDELTRVLGDATELKVKDPA